MAVKMCIEFAHKSLRIVELLIYDFSHWLIEGSIMIKIMTNARSLLGGLVQITEGATLFTQEGCTLLNSLKACAEPHE